MASLQNAHCHLNLDSPAGHSGASFPDSYSFYYSYACQAMLEVRSSGD
jgi:hypothetical protein